MSLPDSSPPSITEAPPDPGVRRLPQLLRRAWYSLNQAFRRRITHLDLTPDQYTVLRNLAEAGPQGITQSHLTSNMTSDPNTVASLVNRMERHGLLRREVDASDRRARRLRLAPAGRRKFRAARTIAMELQDEVLKPLNGIETQQFLSVLEKLAAGCVDAANRN